jgi:hypothetical protein
VGILIGLLIGLIIALLPAGLILFSKSASGKSKAIWFISILLIPYILKVIASAVVLALQGNNLPYGLGPVIPLTWYISAWAIYFLFKSKHGHPKNA